MPPCKDTAKSSAIVQIHGRLLQEKYRKGTYDASEPQASFFSAAHTEATDPSFNLAFLSWACETICIKDYNGKSKYLESEGITSYRRPVPPEQLLWTNSVLPQSQKYEDLKQGLLCRP